jgi:hypothetical protein
LRIIEDSWQGKRARARELSLAAPAHAGRKKSTLVSRQIRMNTPSPRAYKLDLNTCPVLTNTMEAATQSARNSLLHDQAFIGRECF